MAPTVKSKTTSKGKMAPVRGGSAHMFGKSGVMAAKPETMVTHGSGTAPWVKGGGGHMVGKQTVKPARTR